MDISRRARDKFLGSRQRTRTYKSSARPTHPEEDLTTLEESSSRKWLLEELQSNPHINLLEIRAAKESLSLAQAGDIV